MDTTARTSRLRGAPEWPLYVIAMPAIVAIWSGWVGIGGLAGFGVVHPFPGIWDVAQINISITLPVGVEAYAGYAMWIALGERGGPRSRKFAGYSTAGSLVFGSLGQVAYHLMIAAHVTEAPWWITTIVSVLPVAVLGMAFALAHLVRADRLEAVRLAAEEAAETERLRVEDEARREAETRAEETRKAEAEAARAAAEAEAGRLALAQAEAAAEKERLRAERLALAAVGNSTRNRAGSTPRKPVVPRRSTAPETSSDLPRRNEVKATFLAAVGTLEEWTNARLAAELYGVTEPSAKQVDSARVNARNWCRAAGVERATNLSANTASGGDR